MVHEAKSSRNGSRGRGAALQRQPKVNRPSPISSIGKIGSLNRFPDKEYANDLLHQIAKLTAPLIHERGFKVGTLCEMYPKSGNLLGLNVNRGQKVLLRLRYHSNSRLFLPMGDLIGTFLHELTHNIYGAHDAKFYKYLDELKERYEYLQLRGAGAAMNGYVCEEEKLGGRSGGFFVSEREKRLRAVSKVKYIGESKKLGGGVVKPRHGPNRKVSVRELMLEAAERRARDSKWCPSEKATEVEGKENGVEPNDDELDLVTVQEAEPDESKPLRKEFVDIVDLTSELDEGEPQEIIVIDASEEGTSRESNEVKPILKRQNLGNKSGENRQVSFGLLPSLEEGTFKAENQSGLDRTDQIYYVTSTSPRNFILEGEKYPRRKLVADLDFNQIMRYSPKSETFKLAPVKSSSEVDNAEIMKETETGKPSPTNVKDSTLKSEKGKEKISNDEELASKSKESNRSDSNVKQRKTKAKSPNKPLNKPPPKRKPTKRKPAKTENRPRKVVRSVEFSELLD